MEMLTAALAVLCALLTLVLLIQRPSIWPVLLALVVAWGICMAAAPLAVPLGARRQL